VHPNDEVNRCQSSNDVIPTTIHVSCYQSVRAQLLPALSGLADSLADKARQVKGIVKTGRTHLMDALPMRMDQELRAWRHQVLQSAKRIRSVLPRLEHLPIGGTAIGTGANAPPEFGPKVVECLSQETAFRFQNSLNRMADISSPDTALELSGCLRTAAVSMMKISNDLRWMNSGPNAGLGEISLPELQPGSSIMPGKINPVIPEATAMACARVVGNDSAVSVAVQAGAFQLNTMLPLIACNLLENIKLLANSAEHLARDAIPGFTVHREHLEETARRNPILVTALAPKIGYDNAAGIVRKADSSGMSIVDAAVELTDLPREEIEEMLDPKKLTGR
jgi:fumarate hydratase class II